MTLRDVAVDHYRTQAAITRSAQLAAQVIWVDGMRPDLDGSWVAIADRVFVTVAAAQLLAAQQADPYLTAALSEQDADPEPSGSLVVDALAGIASDGRNLDDLLFGPVIRAKLALAGGASMPSALAAGLASLLRIVSAQVTDSGRVATEVAMTARPQVRGWTRMLNPPSCGRCAILAGRVYRWSDGFRRHPGCNCTHVPSAEDAADDLRTDPAAYFRSLSKQDQDKYFTGAGAQAIRDGADMNQIVNARRGAAGLSRPGRLTAAEQRMLRGGKDRGQLQRVDVYGRQVFTTTEGTTVRGLAGQRLAASGGASKQPGRRYRVAKTPRLMPEAIADIAGDDRDERIRLLRRFGYIL